MNRIFTKNATGVAPDGRWYAGDVNALQDAAAAQTDLTQTIALGTIEIGESGLQIVRYGSLEARLTGALRTDGILRALGGLYAGAFTTTQRDAIASGLAPYGLVITNTTTNRLEWNAGTDAARNWQPVGPSGPWGTADIVNGAIANAKLSANATFLPPGTLAARPAANTVVAGTLYLATDSLALYRSEGAANTWTLVGLITDGSGNFSVGGNFRAENGGFRIHRHPYASERHMESGKTSIASNAFSSVTFTNAFSVAPTITCTVEETDATQNGGNVINSIGTTGFSVAQNSGVTHIVDYIVEGAD